MNNNKSCHELFRFFLEESKYRNMVCFNNKKCYFEGLQCDINHNIDKPFIDDLIINNKIKIISKTYETIYYENITKKN
jgi:hypothetical protein